MTEAERVLSDKSVPNGAAGYYLLAHAQEQQSKPKLAVKNY